MASVEVCPCVNSHYKYCTLSLMEELQWLHRTEWLSVCSRCRVDVAAHVFISSTCGYVQGTWRSAGFIQQGRIIAQLLETGLAGSETHHKHGSGTPVCVLASISVCVCEGRESQFLLAGHWCCALCSPCSTRALVLVLGSGNGRDFIYSFS